MVAAPPCGYPTGSYQDPSYPTSPHVFPAMSVNVSMNMTMGVSNVNMGYSPDPALQHQVQRNRTVLIVLNLDMLISNNTKKGRI